MRRTEIVGDFGIARKATSMERIEQTLNFICRKPPNIGRSAIFHRREAASFFRYHFGLIVLPIDTELEERC